MHVRTTALEGVLIIEPQSFGDDRGFFLETYNKRAYAGDAGLDVEFVQDNHSRSCRGVLRGLHFQERNPQGKLVRVARGAVWDVAVDIDPVSSTFKQYVAIELNEENKVQVYIPPGYAHGFCVLSAVADLEYKCTDFYHSEDAKGIAWDDPEIDIEWPIDSPLLSEQDQSNPGLAEYLKSRMS
ncbi:MAG: dTDP-4-dehydrorhamnose 3,5-epimerase [Gammaproteobacteria bacterium]|nr:dTDP-4-dehydrorhamnose 3,5-epimerase [Gammaproteobacteria bacterium]